MLPPPRSLASSVALAMLFTFLFHGTGIGLNLLLFETALFTVLIAQRRVSCERDVLITLGGTFLTAGIVVLYGSTLAFVMNVLSAVLALGVLLAPEVAAFHRSAVLALSQLLAVPRALLQVLPSGSAPGAVLGITPRGLVSGAMVPLIVLVFATLYSASNPFFGELTAGFYAWIAHVDAEMPALFIVGLLVSAAFLLSRRSERLMRWAARATDALVPGTSTLEARGAAALRTDLRTGVVLLATLNALLLVLNVLDIRHVWFDFTFTGQYLKQFVHEGTWLLILSILLGAVIVLYYFRGDLNFHERSRLLRALSYTWLGQNAVLVLSVAMRNHHYIQHYTLAYKRIGVAFFLVATLIALFLVMQKVRRRRSHHYLTRWNLYAAYGVALTMTLFDWDVLIARYNMAHREQAFVELDYLVTLDDKTLPYLIRSRLELENLDSYNEHVLGTDRYSRSLYMRPEDYSSYIHLRTQRFLHEYPERSWREWNMADANSHRVLLSALGSAERPDLQ